MKRFFTLFVVVAALAGLGGCSEKKEEFGDKPQDWKKSAPPAGWKGPGQPGGPPAGARGPGIAPPPSK
ncbi:hypothetical protein [Fimbriimonas ginsengisoli]|uniref:Lipoprotein n=1 Tax=Fimbriimonas ginsengisoli Gsoil 348 TaxID=661478 RepID=A0A068NRK3_FIMGI|nr:hypothetical protein [Fimbriimonas ginsengisoli]AIE86163.1 hypothetical protein OP10G_2795 [Fimbriimonas ginsengisoli Gsoil 348]